MPQHQCRYWPLVQVMIPTRQYPDEQTDDMRKPKKYNSQRHYSRRIQSESPLSLGGPYCVRSGRDALFVLFSLSITASSTKWYWAPLLSWKFAQVSMMDGLAATMNRVTPVRILGQQALSSGAIAGRQDRFSLSWLRVRSSKNISGLR